MAYIICVGWVILFCLTAYLAFTTENHVHGIEALVCAAVVSIITVIIIKSKD